MNRNTASFRSDTRGVNTAVGYVLAIGITTVLITLLLHSTVGFVESHQRSVINTEMEIVGQTIASQAMDVDRAARKSGGETTLERDVSLPANLGGADYTINISCVAECGTAEELYQIRIRTRSPVAEERVQFRSGTSFAEVTRNGGSLTLTYDSTNDEVVVNHG